MRRNLLLLIISLLPTICCFSQTTYPSIISDSLIVITPSQLKATNKIFLEHQMLSEKVIEYDKQILLLRDIIEADRQVEQASTIVLKNISSQNELLKYENSNLEEQISYYKRKSNRYLTLSVGGFTFGIAGLLLILLK